MNSISLGILLGIVALMSGGLANAMVKIPSQKEGPNRTIFYRNIYNVFLLFIVVLLTLSQAHFDLKYIIFTIILSVFGYIPMYYYYKSTTVGKVGVVSPIASSNSLIAIILAVIFFHERLTLLTAFFIIIIIFGIILLSIDLRAFRQSDFFNVKSGVPYAVIAAIGWGFWMAFIKIPIDHLGPYLASLVVEATALVVAYCLIVRNKEKIVLSDKHSLQYIIPISFLMVIWSIGYYLGLKVSSVSIVVAITSASPLVVALYGRIFYQEKLAGKHYFAISLIVLGIIMMSVVK